MARDGGGGTLGRSGEGADEMGIVILRSSGPRTWVRGEGKGGKGMVAGVAHSTSGEAYSGFCSGGGVQGVCLQPQFDTQSFASALTPHRGVCGCNRPTLEIARDEYTRCLPSTDSVHVRPR